MLAIARRHRSERKNHNDGREYCEQTKQKHGIQNAEKNKTKKVTIMKVSGQQVHCNIRETISSGITV